MRKILENLPVAENPTPGRAGLPIHRMFLQWMRDMILAVPERFVPVAVTAAYTARPWDFVQLDASGGAFTVTLPTRPQPGVQIAVSETAGSANNVTFEAATGTTIMGAADATYNTANDGFLLVLAGTDWRRIG